MEISERQQPDRGVPIHLLPADRAEVAAFGRLHAASHQVVWNFLAGLDTSMGHHQREDLVQEVFLRAWRHRAGFRAGSTVQTYLLGIAGNVLNEYLYREGRLALSFSGRLPDDERRGGLYAPSDGSQSDTDAGVCKAIKHAKAGLSNLRRQAFDLVCGRGLSVAQAAATAGCSNNVLSKRLHDARKQLVQKLGEDQAP